jgi:hypothetical protein
MDFMTLDDYRAMMIVSEEKHCGVTYEPYLYHEHFAGLTMSDKPKIERTPCIAFEHQKFLLQKHRENMDAQHHLATIVNAIECSELKS